MDNSLWLNRAISKTAALGSGTEFCLKDLFDGVEWNDLTVGTRLGFGRYFKNEVLEGHIPNVVYIGKAQNNSAKYRKVMKQ